ncbi:uncharacterized protein VTP21DRAFT_9245 [Calcarisporiella thermophila]|uniref:uncharacterized protein n=1 Tax=Calcarisporiella thermophila TaxID=911321 RepID=UPI00374251E1
MAKRKSNYKKKSSKNNSAATNGGTPTTPSIASKKSTRTSANAASARIRRKTLLPIRSPDLKHTPGFVFAFRGRPMFKGEIISFHEPAAAKTSTPSDTSAVSPTDQMQAENSQQPLRTGETPAPGSIGGGGSAPGSVVGTPRKRKKVGVHSEVLRFARAASRAQGKGMGLVRLLVTETP